MRYSKKGTIAMTRAKFTCVAVEKSKHWDSTKGFLYKAKFNSVTSGSEENKLFFAATPSGTIEISTMTQDHFQPGADYYVDFTEAPK
jgi:hypothetical protein